MNRAPEDLGRPDYRAAIVQAQIILVLLAVGVQLFLLTVTVERFLAGSTKGIVALALASAVAFIFALGIWRAYK